MTRTNFTNIKNIKDMQIKNRHFTTAEETEIISHELELENATEIELRNCRDMAVLLLGEWSDSAREKGDWDEYDRLTILLMSISAVIDNQLWNMGSEG